jgi:hypothetical protein
MERFQSVFLETAEDIVLDLRPECHRAVLTWLPNDPVPGAVSAGMSELDLHRTSFLIFYPLLADSMEQSPS